MAAEKVLVNIAKLVKNIFSAGSESFRNVASKTLVRAVGKSRSSTGAYHRLVSLYDLREETRNCIIFIKITHLSNMAKV